MWREAFREHPDSARPFVRSVADRALGWDSRAICFGERLSTKNRRHVRSPTPTPRLARLDTHSISRSSGSSTRSSTGDTGLSPTQNGLRRRRPGSPRRSIRSLRRRARSNVTWDCFFALFGTWRSPGPLREPA
jgi:hypothetical protein